MIGRRAIGCGYKTMKIHIGREIKAELHRQERNVYNIFKRQGIDTRLLERISIILNRNFFALYCQEDSMDVEKDSTES